MEKIKDIKIIDALEHQEIKPMIKWESFITNSDNS